MPAMPRPAGKGKKIAFAILGKPPNLRGDSRYMSKSFKGKLNNYGQRSK